MAIYLIVESGPNLGDRYRLRNRVSIGAKGAGSDIEVEDSEFQPEQALISEDQIGRLYLQNIGEEAKLQSESISSEKIQLLHGLRFTIGGTKFFIEDEKKDIKPWLSQLKLALSKLSRESVSTPKEPIRAFSAPIQLLVLEGRQTGRTWTLGYGPRYIGTDSNDIPIHEFTTGPCGFSLQQTGNSVTFSTESPDLVLLNGDQSSSDELKEGDKVTIGSTVIEIQTQK